MHEQEQPLDPNTGEFILEQLRRFGSDVTIKHEVYFWLYFPSREMANQAACCIIESGLGTEIVKAADDTQWLCLVSCPHIPDEAILDGLIKFLNQVAEQHRGIFDGWETSLEGDQINIPTSN